MVQVLIVEDDHHKLSQLKTFLSDALMASVEAARSVASGKHLIRSRTFDLILLDMSLPSYDIDTHEPGGTPHLFGGRELLGYIAFRGLETPVIVVTQFEKFNTGSEVVDLARLGATLGNVFGTNFAGIVYFNTASDKWRHDLKQAIEELGARL